MKIEWVNQVFLLNFKNLNNIMYFLYTMIIPVRFFHITCLTRENSTFPSNLGRYKECQFSLHMMKHVS